MDLSPDQPSKFCINCKYFSGQLTFKKIDGTEHGFTVPRAKCSYAISPIDGTTRNTEAIFERSLAGHCKPEAVNFLPKDYPHNIPK